MESSSGCNSGQMATCERPFRVRNCPVGKGVSYEEAPRERNRFGRDASYDGALYERNRFVYPLISVPLLMPINGEFPTVGCAFRCFPYK